MPRAKHLHIYRRSLKRKDLYYCTELGCYHNIAKDLLRGKKGLCPICRGELVFDSYALKLAVPTCIKCRSAKPSESHKAALAAISSLFTKKEEKEIQDVSGESSNKSLENVGIKAANF